MDGENVDLRKRLSSILKSARVRGTEEDERTDEISQRRVSFARKSSVKPFTYDAEANHTVWDATYEEAAVQSDQSASHTTADSTVHMCQTNPQQVQSSAGADSLINITCVNMDEDIEIEADDIQFASVRQTTIHNPKFTIFEDKTAYDKPIQDSFINPSLIKENLNMKIGNKRGKEDNMQLESSNIVFNKTTCNYNLPMDIVNNLENKHFALDSSLPGTTMNFTIHEAKTNKPTEQITVPQDIDGNMEFTAVIPTKLLQERLPRAEVDDCENNAMDITLNCLLSNRKLIADCDMEFTTAIPKSVLTVKLDPEFSGNVEDGDMEFTTSVPAVILEKLRRKMQAEHKNNSSSLDDLIIDDAPIQQYKVSEHKECNMDMTMKSENVQLSGLNPKTYFNEENRAEVHPESLRSFAEQQDIVPCVSKLCQFDRSFHTYRSSEIDDTQYLINYKSHITEGSALSAKGDHSKFQVYVDESLPVEITNVLTILENIPQADQKTAIAEIKEDIIANNDNCFQLSAAVNDRTKTDEIGASITIIPQLNAPNVSEKLAEINVFKPSSKNNTQNSYFESMEIGTPYITVTDESIHNSPIVNCYETDKIIFPSESAYSLDIEEVPEKAFGVLRRSSVGLAEEHVVTTLMSTHEVFAKTLDNEPIVDDLCVDIQIDSSEFTENLSASRIILYNSNEHSKISDCSNDNSFVSPIALKKLSYLPDISPNCTLDQLYDLLGWSEEDFPRGVPLPPRISAEEKEKKRAAREAMRLAEAKGFERLAHACRKMVLESAQIDRENAIRAEEDLARSQGRCLRPQTVEEWLKQQRKTQSTLWLLKSLANNNCVVSSRFIQFGLAMESDSFFITNTTVQNIDDNKAVTKLRQFIRKLCVDKMQMSHIQSAIGTKYNLRTFLEYLQMKLDDAVKIEREFLNIFRKLLVEARLSFDDNLILQYLLIGRSRWLIKINCFDINNLSENSITEMVTLTGAFFVPEKEIKSIARKCPRGLPFLSSFLDGVYELRNMRERKHCPILNELLNKMETRMGKL